MKIAHFVHVGPRASGMYETARDLCAAECDLGVEAKLVDTSWIEDSSDAPMTFRLDRGVDIATVRWAETADIFVIHSRIPDELFRTRPAVLVLHGTPEYCFYSEWLNHDKGDRNFSTLLGYNKEETLRKFVTFWKRHLPYWNAILGDGRTACIDPPVALDEYTPDGAKQEFKNPGDFNIGFCDSWRATAFKDPFQTITGVRSFWQSNPDTRLHLFGIPSENKRDVVWDRFIGSVKKNGDFIGDVWERHADMASVYRALDVVITPVKDANRVIRESLACGTPVITPVGSPLPEYTCDLADPGDLSAAISDVRKDLQEQGSFVVKKCLTKAAEFASSGTAEQFIKILEEVRREAICEAS